MLRLPPGTTRPDHYALLGLRYFEDDHDTILRAALERIRLLEACDADPRPGYRKVLRQLIAEVREAQLTLLDPWRRKAYDATLTGADAREAEAEDTELELAPGVMYADRHRILKEVRRGAMGVIYEAMDMNLRAKVHVSILRPRLSHERGPRRRIERAARAAAALDHPHILRLDEVGTGDGLLFVRTRAMPHRTLLDAIEATERMRLEPAEVRRILTEVAGALRYAHRQGIVHGDLRPKNVFLDEEDRTLLADFCTSRAVADALGDTTSRYREPEGEAAPPADLFALGCLAYQMLSGLPPFPADATDPTPKPLPDEVPSDLATLTMELLAAEPEQRPRLDPVIARLRWDERRRKRLPLLAGAAALVVVAVGAVLLGLGGDEETVPLTVEAEAWRLIAKQRFAEAIRYVRQAREAETADASLDAPLAQALEGYAGELEKAGDLWRAQTLLQEAAHLEPSPRRAEALERVRAAAVGKLNAIRLEFAEVTSDPVVAVRAHALRSCVVGGKELVSGPAVPGPTRMPFPELSEGRHELTFVMVDFAGNRRAGRLVLVVDRTAPVVEILEPRDGAQFLKGRIPFRVRVRDENPEPTVSVHGRAVALEGGEALGALEFGDGEHTIDVVARDRAGHEARVKRTVVVDSKAPDLKLAATRIATRDGWVTVRGRVRSRVKRVTVDGRPVEVARDGAFATDLVVGRDRAVPVIAVGLTDLERRLFVQVVVDDRPPAVTVRWERRDQAGALLYGNREMKTGTLALPLQVEDETAVTFAPDVGRVEGTVWHLPPTEGARTVRLEARDEAGNVSELKLAIEGHRATPRLTVDCPAKEITKNKETQLAVDADQTVLVQGRPHPPGRIKVPLPEGPLELVVQAIDRYGNESRWTKRLRVDRTAPEVRLEGELERGIGQQELVFTANEELRTLTCFGKTVPAQGKTARVEAELRQGRRRLHVVAKDLAGNTTRQTFTLEVKNRVLVLDGKSAVQVPLPATVSLDTFTVECWVRGFTPERTSTVLSNYYSRAGFTFLWSSSKKTLPSALLYLENGASESLPARKPWKWESWAHLALSHDGKRVRFYVNGSLQHSVEVAERLQPSKSPLYIGCSPGHNRAYFLGAIDEVRVSNVARYTRGFSPPRFHREDEHTVLLLRFDVLREKLFPDSSDHGHHGVPLGNPRVAAP
ncbi:MAG: protein kinase domain-containing protein [Planctomycetota bacterium]